MAGREKPLYLEGVASRSFPIPMDGPIPKHVWIALTGLNGSSKQQADIKLGRIHLGGYGRRWNGERGLYISIFHVDA